MWTLLKKEIVFVDKKDLAYIVIICILSFLLIREFNNNITLPQDVQQDNFTETLPKMGQ